MPLFNPVVLPANRNLLFPTLGFSQKVSPRLSATVDAKAIGVWTSRTSAADNSWFCIAWSPELGLFAAVANSGTGNRVMTSSDGIKWTTRTSAADNSWISIAWSPELSLFAAVAISGTGNRVMTSPNGITWTIRTSAADNSWLSIVWSPELSLFAATSSTGTGNRVMTSPDGITWTSRTSAADNSWNSISWSPELGLFVSVATTGTGNRVMTSSDGITWTSRTSAADNSWHSVAWSPELGLFAAVAITGTGNRVMTSRNGIIWATRTSATDNSWRGVAWSPELGLFAAVSSTGTGNRVMTSPDGITWTSRTSAVDNSWFSIAWSSELGIFAALANTGTGDRVMTSAPPVRYSEVSTLYAGLAGVGTTSPVTKLMVSDNIITSPRGILSAQFSTTTDGARLHTRKARGTESTPTTVVTGDTLGRLVASGYDSANFLEMANIGFDCEGTIAATRVPTRITFSTATNAAPSVLTEAARISSSQFVGIGTTSPQAKLDVLTKALVTNTLTSATNFERFDIQWVANVLQMWTEKGSGGGTARDFVLGADATEVLRTTSTGTAMATAKVLSVASGANQRAGEATLVAGTVTVSNTTVTANTIAIITRKTAGGVLGTAITYTLSAGASFTINSDNVADTSTFSYFLVEVP